MSPLKLVEGPASYRPRSGQDAEWLESLGKLEVANTFGAVRASIAMGDWGDIQLRICADGESLHRAVSKLADRVEAILKQGHVQL